MTSSDTITCVMCMTVATEICMYYLHVYAVVILYGIFP
jgi:hypothetical protein